MAASSRRTEENVASRNGSGRHWRRASRALLLSLSLKKSAKKLERDMGTHIKRLGISLPKEAADDMLQKPHSLLLNKLRDHVAQDGSDRIKSLISGTDICKTDIIKKNLLYNENRHRLAEFGPSLHDAEAKRNYFSRQEEVDHVRRVILHQCADNTEGGESQVLEGTRLGGGVKEWIEEKRDVSFETSVSRAINLFTREQRTYRSGREYGFRCGMRRIAREPERCRPDSTRQQSAGRD